MTADKALLWMGSARRDLRSFPTNPRRLAGFQLRRVQQGLEPNDWKPMSTVGAGVQEIRLHVEGDRVFFVATFAEAVYVLHAFDKKTQRTAKQDIELGRDRFRDLLRRRQHHGTKKSR